MLVVCGIVLVLLQPSPPPPAAEPARSLPETLPILPVEYIAPSPEPILLVGEDILSGYLDPAGSVKADLILLSHLFISFDTLVKAEDALPLGANGDIADAFRGRNKVHMRFLPDEHKTFNAAGEIVDRWQTPLYFHAETSERIAIRSAGPDRAMWTEDDVQLEPNGRSFTEHSALLPPSLYSHTDQEPK